MLRRYSRKRIFVLILVLTPLALIADTLISRVMRKRAVSAGLEMVSQRGIDVRILRTVQDGALLWGYGAFDKKEHIPTDGIQLYARNILLASQGVYLVQNGNDDTYSEFVHIGVDDKKTHVTKMDPCFAPTALSLSPSKRLLAYSAYNDVHYSIPSIYVLNTSNSATVMHIVLPARDFYPEGIPREGDEDVFVLSNEKFPASATAWGRNDNELYFHHANHVYLHNLSNSTSLTIGTAHNIYSLDNGDLGIFRKTDEGLALFRYSRKDNKEYLIANLPKNASYWHTYLSWNGEYFLYTSLSFSDKFLSVLEPHGVRIYLYSIKEDKVYSLPFVYTTNPRLYLHQSQ